jgi:hypothetical protein
MANFKKITEVPVVTDATGLKFIVNDNGTAKQIDGENIIAKTETPDWTVNDETSPSFIKNKPTKLSQFTNDMYGYREEIFSLTLDDFVPTSFEVEEGQFQEFLLFKAPKLTWLNAETLHFLEYEFDENVSRPGEEDALVISVNSREEPLLDFGKNMYGFEGLQLYNGINPMTQEPMDELWILPFYNPAMTINSLSIKFYRRHENISNENINVDMLFLFGDEKPIFGSYEKALSMLSNQSYPNIPKIIGARNVDGGIVYLTPHIVGLIPFEQESTAPTGLEDSTEQLFIIRIGFLYTIDTYTSKTYDWYPDNTISEYFAPPS